MDRDQARDRGRRYHLYLCDSSIDGQWTGSRSYHFAMDYAAFLSRQVLDPILNQKNERLSLIDGFVMVAVTQDS